MDAFRQAVARSVALSILLTRDYVRSRPPSVASQVALELPRVLRVACQTPGISKIVHDNVPPKDLLDDFVSGVPDALLNQAAVLVADRGHRDMVFAALKYAKKPPAADDDAMDHVSAEVRWCLGLDTPPETFADAVAQDYAEAHMELVCYRV